ncbi:MAG TPA: MFS transporter [Candidatus Sulfotelmatobacter sp.]|nr:MFS transporter [Candidatus Sulfotelmatobacter sp.]
MSKDGHSGAPLSRHAYSGWWAVAVSAVGLSVSIGTVVVYSFGVFLKPLSQEFSWSRSRVSLAISLMNLMVTIGSPSVGRLADLFGSRSVIIPSIVSLAAVLASFYFLGPHLWLLYILYSFAGLVGLGATPLTYSRIVATWFDQERGFALGLTTSGIGIGAFIMPSLAQWIILRVGWRWAYVALALIVLLVPLPLVALFLREAPRKRNLPPKEDDPETSFEPPNLGRSEAVRTRVFWQMLIQFFLISACINGTVAHFSALLTDRAVPAQAAAFAIHCLVGLLLPGGLSPATL